MKLWLLRLFYFVYNLGFGAFQFLNLFYTDLGLSTAQIGTLFAIGPLVMIFAQPLWGVVTDYWDSPKQTLLFMIIGSAGVAMLYPLASGFGILLLLNILYFFFQSAIPPIADVTAMSLLEDRNDFGKIRLWGSFGYAVGVFSVGRILDTIGIEYMFLIHSVLFLLAIFFSMNLPIKKSAKKQFKFQETIGLFKNSSFVMLLLFSFFLHLTVHANNSFYAIYLENLGATLSLVGFALLIKSILEIPFFAMSKKLMSRYSYPLLLSVVALVYGVRWLIVGVSDHLQVLVWSQVLLALSFSIQYFVAVAYVDHITPKTYRATGQTIYWAVAIGLGGLVGNVLAGWVLNYVDISTMYLIAAVLSFLCIGLLWYKPGKNVQHSVEKQTHSV